VRRQRGNVSRSRDGDLTPVDGGDKFGGAVVNDLAGARTPLRLTLSKLAASDCEGASIEACWLSPSRNVAILAATIWRWLSSKCRRFNIR
jgi:hypothetical protein